MMPSRSLILMFSVRMRDLSTRVPGVSAARSDALQNRDQLFFANRGPRISGAPLRVAPRPGHESLQLHNFFRIARENRSFSACEISSAVDRGEP